MLQSTKPTNMGGPAARQGFKYQDHVAVQFLLRMFSDRYAVQVECETADDIVYVSDPLGKRHYEYIQVKTTEGDKKWSYTEVTALDGKKKDSSLIQKSLLCDGRGGEATFRIVSKRGLYKDLDFLLTEHHQRTSSSDADALGARLAKKFKATKSPSGRDLVYWARSCLWQIAGDMHHLEACNLKDLSHLAEQHGHTPSHTNLLEIYEDLLELADAAAVANAITQPNKKIITKKFLETWLLQKFNNAASKTGATAKPYKKMPEAFLVEFHSFFDANLPKGFRGFDVQYDLGQWRSEEFARHLVEWLPEFALKPSELVAFGHHNATHLLAQAHARLGANGIEQDKIIAEIILHSLLRTTHESEPIACKVFYVQSGEISCFGNAHIIHNKAPAQDELWLGQARLVPLSDYTAALDELAKNLENAITKAALSKEREIIVSLREANHLLPVTQQLDQALLKNSKLEDLLRVLCFPVMLAYDSDTLSAGYADKYLDLLKQEIENTYHKLTSNFDQKIESIKIIIFFIPSECVKTLAEDFKKACKNL